MEFSGDVAGAGGSRRLSAVSLSLPAGRQPLLIDELQALLRQRLRGFASFSLAGFTIALTLDTFIPVSPFRREHPAFVNLPVFVPPLAGVCFLLYSRWSSTLPRLRLLEGALFLILSLQFGLGMYRAFEHGILIGEKPHARYDFPPSWQTTTFCAGSR